VSQPPPDNAQCASCRVQRGTPVTVTVGHNKRVITYKCEKCAHDWTVERTEPPARLK
jgi:hypothetical protein